MKAKIVALLFLAKCFFYIAKRIALGRKWNMIIADLEETSGRRRLVYRITAGKFVLEDIQISRHSYETHTS